MPSYTKRKNSDGTTAVLAQVRVRPFKADNKTFANMDDARAWAEPRQRELKKLRREGNSQKNLTTFTLAQLIELHLADPETQALNTLEGRKQLLGWWSKELGGEKILELGIHKVRAARDRLCQGRQPATVNRHISAFRTAWNWARGSGYIPVEKVFWPKLTLREPSGRVRFLNDSELTAVLAAAEKYAVWMHAAVVTSLATGLRQGELLRLEWKDVDFDKQTVVVLISKNKKRRLVHLPTPAIESLKKLRHDRIGRQLIFVRPDGEPVDSSFLYYHWDVLRTQVGLIDFRWHDLRHSTASYLAQNGATLLEISGVLGHSSPAMTQRYAHLVAGAPITGSEALAKKLSS
jgi:integrase